MTPPMLLALAALLALAVLFAVEVIHPEDDAW